MCVNVEMFTYSLTVIGDAVVFVGNVVHGPHAQPVDHVEALDVPPRRHHPERPHPLLHGGWQHRKDPLELEVGVGGGCVLVEVDHMELLTCTEWNYWYSGRKLSTKLSNSSARYYLGGGWSTPYTK